MFIACGRKYYEVGDSVDQTAYPGCPSVIVAIEERKGPDGWEQWATIDIDTTNEPDAMDENWEHQNKKTIIERCVFLKEPKIV